MSCLCAFQHHFFFLDATSESKTLSTPSDRPLFVLGATSEPQTLFTTPRHPAVF